MGQTLIQLKQDIGALEGKTQKLIDSIAGKKPDDPGFDWKAFDKAWKELQKLEEEFYSRFEKAYEPASKDGGWGPKPPPAYQRKLYHKVLPVLRRQHESLREKWAPLEEFAANKPAKVESGGLPDSIVKQVSAEIDKAAIPEKRKAEMRKLLDDL